MDLCGWLEQENPCLHRCVMDIRRAVEPILERPVHYHFTDHSLKHSERVIEKLDGLTEVLMGSPEHCLSTTEAYILLAAAYLHDIGMQDQRHKPDMEWIRTHYGDEMQSDPREAELERIRRYHHELTREMILEYLGQRGEYIELGLPRIPIVDETAALIAEAHRKVDLSKDTFNEFSLTLVTTVEAKFIVNSNATTDQTKILRNAETREEIIRPRLLAALLRFADELDIDRRRVYIDRLKLMQANDYSHLCWYLCDYVDEVQIENEFITIYYRFPLGCDRYESLIRPLVENEIEAKWRSLKDIFWPNGVKPTINSKPGIEFTERAKVLPREVERVAEMEVHRLEQEKSYQRIEEPSSIPLTTQLSLDLEI